MCCSDKSEIELTADAVAFFLSLSLFSDMMTVLMCVCRVYASAVCLVEEEEKRRIDACAYICVELAQAD
jgi:hypothetical protein